MCWIAPVPAYLARGTLGRTSLWGSVDTNGLTMTKPCSGVPCPLFAHGVRSSLVKRQPLVAQLESLIEQQAANNAVHTSPAGAGCRGIEYPEIALHCIENKRVIIAQI